MPTTASLRSHARDNRSNGQSFEKFGRLMETINFLTRSNMIDLVCLADKLIFPCNFEGNIERLDESIAILQDLLKRHAVHDDNPKILALLKPVTDKLENVLRAQKNASVLMQRHSLLFSRVNEGLPKGVCVVTKTLS